MGGCKNTFLCPRKKNQVSESISHVTNQTITISSTAMRQCLTVTNDIYKHIVSSCPIFVQDRLNFMNIISRNVSAQIGTFLQSTTAELFYCTVIGSVSHRFPDICKESLIAFLKISFSFVSSLLRLYGVKA